MCLGRDYERTIHFWACTQVALQLLQIYERQVAFFVYDRTRLRADHGR